MKFFYLFLCLVSFVYAEEGAPFERGSDSEADNEKKSPHEFTGNLTFISDYRSRGISQTFCRPSIQGELKYKFIPAGYYVKTQGFNVDGTSVYLNDTSLEWDFFAGIENEIGDFGYDAGFIYYYYPGGQSFVPRRCSYDTLESYLGVSYKGLEVKLWITLDDFFATNSHNLPFNWQKNRFVRPNGHSRGSPYIEMNYNRDFSKTWSGGLHAGYQAVTHYSMLNYWEWQASLTYKFEWLDLTVYYIQTNAKRAFYNVPNHSFKEQKTYLGRGELLIGVTKHF